MFRNGCAVLAILCFAAPCEAGRGGLVRGALRAATAPVRVLRRPACSSSHCSPVQKGYPVQKAGPVQKAAPATQKALPAPAQKAATGSLQSLAQQKANEMAQAGYVYHRAPIYGFEGVGMGATPAAACANCCSNGGRVIARAVARGARGMWFAVTFRSN